MAFDWKKLVSTVAPTVATAFGSPLAGMATQVISSAILGRPDATDDEIAATMAGATPDTLVKIKEADHAFRLKLEELKIDLAKVNAGDTADARKREKETGDSWTPRILAGLIVIGWMSFQWFILKHVVAQEMREIVLRSMGTMDMALGLVIGYYFGSSRGSQAKDATIERMAG